MEQYRKQKNSKNLKVEVESKDATELLQSHEKTVNEGGDASYTEAKKVVS